jgi:hypothetical protein
MQKKMKRSEEQHEQKEKKTKEGTKMATVDILVFNR